MITGKETQEHLSNLEAVLQKLQEYILHIKSAKCEFLQNSVEYLGQVISAQGVNTSHRKVEVVLKMSPLTNQ